MLAEGGAALVLELLEAARARGANRARIARRLRREGRRFPPHPFQARRLAGDRRGRAALEDAGIDESGIDYVNAHGTSTPENDKMEHLSLATVFGERMRKIPISSNKSMIGHTLSAAGAVEAVFSLMTIREGVIPPTINYDNPDPAIELDVVPNVKRSADVGAVLSNSFGFGGQNACLVIAREPA